MYMKNNLPAERRGFTLIELLVVIGILAVLLAITLIAINPAKQFAQANNTKRSSDVNAILNGVGQYAADNKGVIPTGITTSAQNIADTGADICAELITTYLAALPVDPLLNNGTPVTNCAAAYNTNYTIVRSASDNRITVTAPAAELGATIAVTR
jgi:prepilin-type N-terminal cleavage/methylation domain-containing protein